MAVTFFSVTFFSTDWNQHFISFHATDVGARCRVAIFFDDFLDSC